MFLRCQRRRKDGKTHEYWSVVENRRPSAGRVAPRQVLYLSEINAKQRKAWRNTIEVCDEGQRRQVALMPAGSLPRNDVDAVGVCLSQLRLQRPRQWGDRIEHRYDEADRIRVMDSGIPTDDNLAKMRSIGANDLVGTPKGRLSKLEQAFLNKPWARVRDGMQVRRLKQVEDVQVLEHGDARIDKERGMRRKRLRSYPAGRLPGHTTLLITAEGAGLLRDCMALARLLQPALVLIEDADLVARERAAMLTIMNTKRPQAFSGFGTCPGKPDWTYRPGERVPTARP